MIAPLSNWGSKIVCAGTIFRYILAFPLLILNFVTKMSSVNCVSSLKSENIIYECLVTGERNDVGWMINRTRQMESEQIVSWNI